VLLGGPPCQAFSVYNHQRGFHDERSGLFREYLRVVEELRPKVIVMENVTGMKDLGNGRAIREIHQRLGKLGYQVEHRTLKSEEYGVPQERRRIFFVGTRLNGLIQWPEITHGSGTELFDAVRDLFVTVADAISDLPLLKSGEGRDEVRPYTRQPRSDYQRAMRRNSPGVTNHAAPRLAQINMERMKHIPPGGSWRDLPWNLLPAGMKRARRSDHTKRYGRLHPKGLACTILTKCDPHWGAYFHPDQDRAISVREAARLQSFPDRFQFIGPRGEQYRQVGNAVPPLLARAVARSVLEMLAADSRRNRAAVAV
jgi:DNA (cytosine-5)-methyltransferase 1